MVFGFAATTELGHPSVFLGRKGSDGAYGPLISVGLAGACAGVAVAVFARGLLSKAVFLVIGVVCVYRAVGAVLFL
ncbi:hypothetical protein ACIO3O_27375 [Streptomyces sp. NPDC087440]|uniref:hypothetical protein n=1 Tax=Streptomyces sp. NPDC087440 TaxID=3365790 RepID=UPI0037F86CDC